MDWQADYITYYFDGNEVWKTATPADLNEPMYMIANLAVGGYWPGMVDSTTPFPAEMKIDYIRAYSDKGVTVPPTTPPTTPPPPDPDPDPPLVSKLFALPPQCRCGHHHPRHLARRHPQRHIGSKQDRRPEGIGHKCRGRRR